MTKFGTETGFKHFSLVSYSNFYDQLSFGAQHVSSKTNTIVSTFILFGNSNIQLTTDFFIPKSYTVWYKTNV